MVKRGEKKSYGESSYDCRTGNEMADIQRASCYLGEKQNLCQRGEVVGVCHHDLWISGGEGTLTVMEKVMKNVILRLLLSNFEPPFPHPVKA